MIAGNSFTTSVRGITPETFDHWRYLHGEVDGRKCHIANHFVDGQQSGQKLRFPGKEFSVFGKMDSLYGRWLWPNSGKRVVVVEGELDALSVSQVQGNKWPVVSVPNGAQGAESACKKAIEFLSGFDEVVFMFDNDEPGNAAAILCAKLLQPGKAKIATLPLKDANAMLVADRGEEIIRAIWNAKPYRPDGVVCLSDVKAKALTPITRGMPWVFPTLDEHTYGRRVTETVYLGAGTGVGKTDFLTEQINFDLQTLGINVGCLMLEQLPSDTVKRIIGKASGKRFHVPDGSWTPEDLVDWFEALEKARGQLFLYDNFGATEWANVKDRIRFMALACGCKTIYLDHLTALAAAEEDEKKALEEITAEIAGLAMQLGIWICVVSHLTTPETGSHEEGARVTIRQFKGSRAIGYWAHYMLGLERDQQSDEGTNAITTLRILKDRYTGQATGKTIGLRYDPITGRQSEADLPPKGVSPFAREQQQDSDF